MVEEDGYSLNEPQGMTREQANELLVIVTEKGIQHRDKLLEIVEELRDSGLFD